MKTDPRTLGDILLFAISLAVLALLCGCQTPRTSYMNGVIFWTSSTAIGLGYGEYIEVAPGGKVDRKIKGEKDTLHLFIDNGEVKVKEESKSRCEGEGEGVVRDESSSSRGEGEERGEGK